MLMVLALGIRHGFDLDHIATIDAITRAVKKNSTFSQWVGILFSLGHGSVVVLISLLVGSGLIQGMCPAWLEPFGRWVSIFFLFSFGVITLLNIKSNDRLGLGAAGPKSMLFQTFIDKKFHPFSVVCIGALFSISFDTVTQVLLFGVVGSVMAGWLFTLSLGVLFMLGMMIADGLNGWLMSILIQKIDKRSAWISQSLGFLIALFNLILGFMSTLHAN